MTETDVNYFVGAFAVELHGVEAENHFKNKQLPLNDNENNFDEIFYNKNYKKTVRKLHDAGWKNSYFIYADVDMLVH